MGAWPAHVTATRIDQIGLIQTNANGASVQSTSECIGSVGFS